MKLRLQISAFLVVLAVFSACSVTPVAPGENLIALKDVGKEAASKATDSDAAAKALESITWDTTTVDALFEWADSDSLELPTNWQQARPYVLTREWATWSGLPDPDQEVLRLFAEVIKMKTLEPGKPRFVNAKNLLQEITKRKDAFVKQTLPHIKTYLPAETEVRGNILFVLFVPAFAFAWGDGSIVINLTAGYFEKSADKVLNLLVHELFHQGIGQYYSGASPEQLHSPSALVDNILWQTQNEGLATYVAFQIRPENIAVQDYELLETDDEVKARFAMLNQLIHDASLSIPEDYGSIKKRIWEQGTTERAFYVVGAYMARQIETVMGREALVNTVLAGPRAFFSAYEATEPALLIRF